MIYVFENPDNYASIVFDETTLTPSDKAKGIAIEQLPEKNIPEGKVAILKCRKSTGEVWYDYVDIIPTPEDLQAKRINELETAILETTVLLAEEQAKNIQNEQAILELSMLIGGNE